MNTALYLIPTSLVVLVVCIVHIDGEYTYVDQGLDKANSLVLAAETLDRDR